MDIVLIASHWQRGQVQSHNGQPPEQAQNRGEQAQNRGEHVQHIKEVYVTIILYGREINIRWYIMVRPLLLRHCVLLYTMHSALYVCVSPH